ncbi:MAG: TIGR02710 family CRISPR-associated CARF protein [Planctomycetota bacterium]
MTGAPRRLLICTVGGTPDPIVKALLHWQPIKVCFLPTPQTRSRIDLDSVNSTGNTVLSIIKAAKAAAYALDAGRYEIHELSDGEDLASCLTELHRLTDDVERWVERGAEFEVIVDFTGGTKCMSAAVALQASRWPCVFSYVGGPQRTKDGVGTVQSGHERVVHRANPWEALGHRAVEDFAVLFDQHAFLAAANLAARTMKRVDKPSRKRELAVLEQLGKALDAWDRFDHGTSLNHLRNVLKSENDLRAVLGEGRASRILTGTAQLTEHLDQIRQATPPSPHHVVDLLGNAERRKEEGRFDDAVARLYRAIEAIAQVTLRERHAIQTTEAVPLGRIPEPLRTTWATRAIDNVVALGLQDAYALLSALDDPLGTHFQDAGLSGKKSPLVARNRSILAHGFERASDTVYERLWTTALSLAGVDIASLPSFPLLVESGS